MAQTTDDSGISRRKFITIIGAMPVLASADIVADSIGAGDVDRFLQLSSTLTGFPASELNYGRAQQLLGWIIASSHSGSLASALEDSSLAVDDELAEIVITAWYSGVISIDDDSFVDTYTDALIWQTAWFTTPKTVCSPVPNDWALPPETH